MDIRWAYDLGYAFADLLLDYWFITFPLWALILIDGAWWVFRPRR